MLKSYFFSSVRGLLKDKLYTAINIVGLAIGLATCLVIFSWVHRETNYDNYLPGSENVFRVTTHETNSGDKGLASTYPMVKRLVLEQFPEAEATTRLFKSNLLGAGPTIAYDDKIFNNDILYYGDPTFFKVFPFVIVKGTQDALYERPNAVVLTQRTAVKYFGEEDPIGKILSLNEGQDLEVTGVMQDIPLNTHFNFDMLVSMESHPWVKRAETSLWSGVIFYTYVKLREGRSPDEYLEKINNRIHQMPNDPNGFGKDVRLALQPIRDIHLKSNLEFEQSVNGDVRYVYIFSTVAFLVLMVGAVNYINLASARYTRRYKEVGIRKVMGAQKLQLIFQFASESLLVTCGALVLAFFLFEMTQPFLHGLAGGNLIADDFWRSDIFLAILAGAFVLGIITGIVPSFVLASLHPLRLFKPLIVSPASGFSIRKVLITFQFTVSMFLTACTLVAYQQMQFVGQMKLGFDKDNLIVMKVGNSKLQTHYAALKSKLSSHSSILSASAVSQLPINVMEGEGVNVSDKRYEMNYFGIDKDFFTTMDISVLEGADRIANVALTDTINYFVLNESAAREMGWKNSDAIGKEILLRHGNMVPGPVIGVVSDFHFKSLHQAVGPVVMEFKPYEYQYLLVRVVPGSSVEALQYLKNSWKDIAGAFPADYSFLDQDYDNLYKSEARASSLFTVFASVTLLLALLGLFALAAFSVERRTKEIGIRKVLGATTQSIIYLLSKEFSVLLVFAFLIATPACYFLMDQWLSNFAYRTSISFVIFVFAAGINILLAWITLGYQGMKAAATTAADTLRTE